MAVHPAATSDLDSRSLDNTQSTVRQFRSSSAFSASRFKVYSCSLTWLRYHLVLATQFRHGVFDATFDEAITGNWRSLQSSHRFLIDKVSFVPDHVHVAVSVHPMASPANVVIGLMNAAQETMWRDFETFMIKARINRLWQPSADNGSFGQLSSNAVSAYLNRWSRQRD